MYRTFWSRALVGVAVTGAAFLLGRALSPSAAQEIAGAEESEPFTEQWPGACQEDCRFRAGLPEAPALPRDAEPPPELLVRNPKRLEIKPAAGEVITARTLRPAAEAPTVAELLPAPSRESTRPCPAFMPYIDDEPSAGPAATSPPPAPVPAPAPE